jgi:hypothetical protein
LRRKTASLKDRYRYSFPVSECLSCWISRKKGFGNGVATVICWDMADGQVVLVTTEPLGSGSPVRSVYFVAEQDPEMAKAIIRAMMAPNEKVEAWGRLPEAAVKALGLKRGDFTHG